jgi:hypothetical protein
VHFNRLLILLTSSIESRLPCDLRIGHAPAAVTDNMCGKRERNISKVDKGGRTGRTIVQLRRRKAGAFMETEGIVIVC